MKKQFILFAVLAVVSCTVSAQTTEAEKSLTTQTVDSTDGWDYGGKFGLNISQVSLSNWSAGGQSSMAITGTLALQASYKQGNGLFENFFDIAYGTMKQGEENWWKTDDKIDFTSKYGYKIKKNLYVAALVNFKTQMDEGYNYPDDSTLVSKFMAPGYFLGAIGLEYKPNKKFSLYVSPITSKYTIVLDEGLANFGAYGLPGAEYDENGVFIKDGDKTRGEFGAYIRTVYKQNIMKNVDLETKLELFTNYVENPQNIDVNWEVLLAMKVNKFITASISTQLVYDDDVDILLGTDDNGDAIVGPRVQFKEVLQVGLTLSF